MSVLKTANLHPQAIINQSSTLFDDFYNYTTANLWTSVAGSSGTSVAAAPDKLLLTTAATNNDLQGVRSTLASFTYTSGVAMLAETYMTVLNQATNTQNVFFGFSSTTSLTSTDGAVPTASMTNALIMKLDGESYWRVQTSNATAKSNNLSTTPATDGNYILHIDIFNFDGLNAGVSFSVNGVALLDSVTGLQIVHKVPYSAAAAMYVIAMTQAGSANVQTQSHDYITASKFRGISLS